MEIVRKDIGIGADFSELAFERAFAEFHALYSVAPLRALCSPDVLSRFCALFEGSADAAHLHSGRMSYRGVPLTAAVIPRGTIRFEGEVDDVKMGDW